MATDRVPPIKGSWPGLYFNGAQSGCELSYTDIQWAGASLNGRTATLRCSQSQVFLSSCTLANGAGHGVYCEDINSYVSVAGTTIRNHNNYPFRVPAQNTEEFLRQTYSANTINQGEILCNLLLSDATWNCEAIDRMLVRPGYDAANHITIYDLTVSFLAGLTLEPGTKLDFDQGSAMTVYGTLIASGATSNHVVLSSSAAVPNAGDWQGIKFEFALDGFLSYCEILYAGAPPIIGQPAAVECSGGAQPSIANCRISHSSGFGVYCDSISQPILSGTEITACQDYALVANINVFQTYFDQNNIHDNLYQAVGISGGTLATSTVWDAKTFTRVFMDEIIIPSGVCLEWGSDVTVKGRVPQSVRVQGGTLKMRGATGHPAVLTSFNDRAYGHICGPGATARGDWGSIVFEGMDSGANEFSNAVIAYGGNSMEMLQCGGFCPVFSNMTLRESGHCGMSIASTASLAHFSGCHFYNNTVNGCNVSGLATFDNCAATTNGGDGIASAGNQGLSAAIIIASSAIGGNGGNGIAITGSPSANMTMNVTSSVIGGNG
ncbi:MAG: right-handed parallel beta-helix repeat-containing protein [Candidatus Sumerlaeota bacterium]|nr:right-handed parallel beta-helix repeat-containing protein [Candidatus Sumerlaeota bacterium]